MQLKKKVNDMSVRKLTILCIIPFLFVSILAKGKITLAVLDFEAKNVAAESSEAVSDLLRTELFNTGRFDVIERQQIRKIFQEQKLQMSGMTETDKAAEIGRLLNVEKIMIGTVTKLGRTYIINTRIVDVQSALMVLAEAVECTGGEEQLPRSISELAMSISYKVGLEGQIIRISEKDIYIDLGLADGVDLGQGFDVIRKGEAITDLEGRIIGTSDEIIGQILLTKVQDRFSIAGVANKKSEFKKGDLVKPTENVHEEVIKEEPVQKEPVKKKKPASKKDDGPEVPTIF